jgi:integrase
MPVLKRKAKKGFVYWIAFKWKGKRRFERSGTEARAARSLLAQRRQEVRDGTYNPAAASEATTVGQWVETWLDRRTTRNAENEVAQVRRHAMSREWFTSLAMRAVDVPDAKRLVMEIKESVSAKTGRQVSWKTVGNIHGTLRTAFRDALELRVVDRNPFILPRKTIHRRKGAVTRTPYTKSEIETLCEDERIPVRQRVWNAIAFFTGMREGEVCGRTWADWEPDAKPYGAIHVHSQYDGQVLKTATDVGEHARAVPVHPFLADVLTGWRDVGFELFFGRPPLPTDPIVPALDGSHYTRWALYNAWRRALALVGVANRSVHSTRHTFVTLCRRGGAPADVVERITHNAMGKTIDIYTHLDWAPLCRAVLVLGGGDAGGGVTLGEAFWKGSGAGIRTPTTTRPAEDSEGIVGTRKSFGPHDFALDATQGRKGRRSSPTSGRAASVASSLPFLLPELVADEYALRLERAEALRSFRAAALGWFRRAA